MLNESFKKCRVRAFFLVALTTFFLAACYPVTRSKGKVTDIESRPIAGAKVKITGKSAHAEELKTGADGVFDFEEVEIISHQEPIEIELIVEKEGFQTYTKNLIFNSENADEIILRK